jgi:GAF domain-containing protein
MEEDKKFQDLILALQKKTHNLGERVKELNCLYGLANLVDKPGIELADVFQGTVDLIPTAWQHPEITCARLVLDNQEFRTSNFVKTPWRLSSDILVYGEIKGVLEVYYLEGKTEGDEDPFLKEERILLNAVVERLGRVFERYRMDEIQAALYEISEISHDTQEIGDLFRSIHQILGNLLHAGNFYIALLDPATGLLSFPYFVDEFDEPPEPQEPGRGLTAYVLKTGKPLLATPDVLEGLVKKGKVEPAGAPSVDWLGIPLIAHQKTIGVLAVQSYTEKVRFSEQDKSVLEFVSNQIATAIVRMQGEQALRESEEQLSRACQCKVYPDLADTG